MPRRNLTILLAVMAVSLLCYVRGEQDPFARYVVEGYEKIDRYALDDVPDEQLFQGAMRGMVGVLQDRGDEHSQFITTQQARLFREELSQEIGGIGVRLKFDGEPPALVVAGPPLAGKPADRGGIRAGDHILAINGDLTDGLTARDFSDVLDHMRGEPGQTIELTVLHEGDDKPVTVKLVRERLTLDSLRGDRLLSDQSWDYLLEVDPRIALVRIVTFGAKSVSELQEVMPKLLEAGARAVILDLRGNPGGPLDAAVETCELFLPADKLIVETRDRFGKTRDSAHSRGDRSYLDLPLVVLVDRNSASASEIVAGALQDHGRAVVMGERSFGKGTVQELLPMQAGESLLKLTRASFWRPSGKNIHRGPGERDPADKKDWGVRPDPGFEVELDDEAQVAWLKARAERDSTVYDPQNEQPPEKIFIDETVERAVAYLQEELDK